MRFWTALRTNSTARSRTKVFVVVPDGETVKILWFGMFVSVGFVRNNLSEMFGNARRPRVKLIENQIQFVRPEKFDEQRFENDENESPIQRSILQQLEQTQQTAARRSTADDVTKFV